ncbi:CAP10 domain-containing protein [Mycena kentingensis (nom. inval.)]|nr:CAP10 domain-containing protein [Mycena kentingensis (nom. inval.)]
MSTRPAASFAMRETSNELWGEIFALLDQDELLAVQATSRLFRQLARPLVFAMFDFKPYGFQYDTDDLYLFVNEYLDFEIQRLDHYSSADVAPLVRECILCPWRPSNYRDDSNYVVAEEPFVLLNTFFERIELFSRLHSLTLSEISLTGSAMAGIFHLPRLRSLSLEDLPEITRLNDFLVAPGQRSTLEYLDIGWNFVDESKVQDMLLPWIPFFNPETLRTLDLGCTLPFWTVYPKKIPIFPLLTSLYLRFSRDDINESYRVVLAKLPALQRLEITGSGSLDEFIAGGPVVLPALEYLKSLPILFTVFVPHSPRLNSLASLWGSTNDLRLLRETPLPNVVSLHLEVSREPTVETLQLISAIFPRLEKLWLGIEEITGVYDVDIPLLNELSEYAAQRPVPLPQTLRALLVTLRCDESRHHSEINFIGLRESLSASLPALASLWIGGSTFLFKWRRGVNVPHAVDTEVILETRGAFQAAHGDLADSDS